MTLQRLGKVLTSILLVFLMTEAVFAATATTTTLAVGTNPQWGNQKVTLTATVSGQSAPTGQVTFKEGTNVIGTAVVNASGIASTAVLFNKTGNLSVRADYGGDANNTASSSNMVSVPVTKVATTTTITATPNPGIKDQVITLTATVTSPVPGAIPTGSVRFTRNGNGTGSAGINASGVATLTDRMGVGTHSMGAEYNGSTVNNPSNASVISLTVNPPATSTTLALSANPVLVGQNVVFTVMVVGTGSVSGTVTIKDGTTVVTSSNVSGTGSATLNAVFSTAGPRSLTASYSGNPGNAASTSSVTALAVQAVSSTVLSVSPNPVVSGQNATLSATVTGSAPTGVVTFKDGATVVGTAPVNASGVATLVTSFIPAGSHSLTASYGGDSNNTVSNSGAVALAVQAASSTVLVVDANPVVSGQSVTLSATVTGSTPTGTVTFRDGAAVVGTAAVNASGVATLVTSFIPVGGHSLTASYGGDVKNTVSNSAGILLGVNGAPSITALVVSANPVVSGQSITLSATVTGSVPAGVVTFKDGATVIGTAALNASGLATLVKSFIPVGSHSLTASYGGDANNTISSSAPVVLVVNVVGSTTALAVSANPVVSGQNVTLSATVTGSTPTGVVTFREGASVLGTAPVNASGVATLVTAFTPVGSHSLVASYAGDTNNGASNSAAASLTVTIATTSTTLTVSPSPAAANQIVTLTANVTGSTPTGAVIFNVGSESRTVVVAGSKASFSGVLPAGQYTVSASYSGDTNNNASSATAASLEVASAVCP